MKQKNKVGKVRVKVFKDTEHYNESNFMVLKNNSHFSNSYFI